MSGAPAVVTPELKSAYDSARHGGLVVEHKPPGVLHLRGKTALDFLHRMSTNALADLGPGEMRGTVLTTAIGRTVDVVQIFRRSSEVLLLTSPSRGEAVQAWLARYIFFNDDVQIQVDAGPFSFLAVYGPAAADEARKVTGAIVQPGAFSEVEDGVVWRTGRPVEGVRLLAGPELAARARAQWREGPSSAAGIGAYEALRIEAGQPEVGREIDDDVIPLEAGLWDLVSFDKGCYIGQEVIARMESRSRIPRRLAGVVLEQIEEAPQEILLDGQGIGRLTSVATSPRFGAIGLALVRAAAAESEPVALTLSSTGGPVRLQSLPFNDRPD